MSTIRREIPKIIVMVFGLIMILGSFTTIPIFDTIKAELTSWTVTISSVSVWLGAVYATYANYRLYQRNRKQGIEHLIYFVVPFVVFGLQFGSGILYGVESAQYRWYFTNIYQNIGSTVYAVMFFTLASSAYRTFIASSWDATALLAGGIIYTLRQIPLFQVWIPGIVGAGEWVMLVPNVGGGRGAVIAAALGALALGIRTLMGQEATITEGG